MHHKTLNKRNEKKTTKISYFYNSENELSSSSRSPALVLNRVLKCIFL